VDLIIYQMMELEVIHITDGYAVIKLLAGAAVIDNALAVFIDTGLDQHFLDVLQRCAVEHRGLDLPAALLGGKAEVYLEHLTDVHTGRNAQGVKHNVKRCAVLEEGHILLRQDAGNNTLVTVAARHLVADRDLALLCNIDTHNHVYARRQLVAVLTGKHLDVDNDAGFTVRSTQRGIAHLACLLAEDRAQQALLRSQLGLALGRYLTDQDITCLDLCAHADDTALVEVA